MGEISEGWMAKLMKWGVLCDEKRAILRVKNCRIKCFDDAIKQNMMLTLNAILL